MSRTPVLFGPQAVKNEAGVAHTTQPRDVSTQRKPRKLRTRESRRLMGRKENEGGETHEVERTETENPNSLSSRIL